jgi:hypothetical protein
VGEGELGTVLSLLPKIRSGSGEVESAGTFPVFAKNSDMFHISYFIAVQKEFRLHRAI